MRQLKPYKVGEITNREKATRVELLFDRNKGIFFAELNGERVEAETLEEVKKLARGLSTTAAEPLKWRRWIEAEVEETNDVRDEGMSFRFDFRRFERAKSQSGRVLERDFGAENEGRELYGWERRDLEREVLVPYSDEAWEALGKVNDQLNAFARRLREFFALKDPKALAKAMVELGSAEIAYR